MIKDTRKELSMTLDKRKIPWEGVITSIQGNVLEGLARYKFLTMSQMLSLDIGTVHYQYLHRQIASLRDRIKPLVGCHNFKTPQPRKGKVESMYFLTKKGKLSLIHDLMIPEEEIKIPIGKTVAYKDYLHRKSTIDFQIALDKWANDRGYHVPFFDTYFDKTGNNRVSRNLKAKTRIALSENDYFIPDGAFKVFDTENEQRFYLFEMYNGKDSARIVRQMHKHAQSMTFRCTHRKYSIEENKSYKVVLVFQFESIMQAVIERVQKDPAFTYIKQYFICKTIEDVREKDFNEWVNTSGEIIPF